MDAPAAVIDRGQAFARMVWTGPAMTVTYGLTRRAFGGGALAVLPLRSGLIEPPLRLPPSERLTVALTLDACPGAFDERLAQVLVKSSIPATIFITTVWMRRNPTGLAFLLAHRDLFSLQNNGDRHVPPVLGEHTLYGIRTAGTLDAIRAEVANGASAIVAASSETPKWYRGAAALYSPGAIAPIRQMGFGIAGYSLNADMGASLPAATVAARIAKARDGDVIIGHINQPLRPSGAGIAAGVVALKRQGVAFVFLPDQTAM